VDLVVRVGGSGRDEPHRAAGRGPKIALLGQGIKALERAVLAEALEPGPDHIEDRVG